MDLHRPAAEGTEGHVRRLIVEALGTAARSLERMTFGHGSIVYKVGLDDRDVIVRTHPDAALYAGTLDNLERLRTLGLPVPTVLAADLTSRHFPFVYLITDAFRGRDLRFELATMTRPQMSVLASQVTAFERLAMTLPAGDGYGFRALGAPGPYRTWSDVIQADRGGIRSTDTATMALTADVYAAFADAGPRLDTIAPTCFLDDLTIKNVIVDRGVLQGVVDFDVVCYGDPMYWLALTQVAVLSDVGEPGRFYVDELTRLWQPTDEEYANLALYSAIHATEFLTYSDDPERHTRLTQAIRGWLAG